MTISTLVPVSTVVLKSQGTLVDAYGQIWAAREQLSLSFPDAQGTCRLSAYMDRMVIAESRKNQGSSMINQVGCKVQPTRGHISGP